MIADDNKTFVCDASSLIALGEGCFLWLLYQFKRKYKINFIIPEMVEYECIERPFGIKEFSMNAVALRNVVNDGIINVIDDPDIKMQMFDIMKLSNNLYFVKGKPIHLVDKGEAAMIALAKKYGYSFLLMDERTTRLIIEDPDAIKRHFEKEFNKHVGVNEKAKSEIAKYTKGLKVIRSSEIVSLAYKVGFFDKYKEMQHDALRAALYKMKFSGCAVSFDEINQILSIVK